MTRGVSSARTSDEGLFWIFKFVFPVQYWDSLRRRRGSAGEKDGRRPVGVKETITSGKKKDPREAGKKGRRSDDDCRGKEGGEPGPPLGRERRKEGRDRGEKGKFTPRGKCPNRSTAPLCRCRLRRRRRRPFKSFFLFGSVSARISESADLRTFSPCRLSVCQAGVPYLY